MRWAARVITLGVLIGLSLAAFADFLTGKVVKITDGDTLYELAQVIFKQGETDMGDKGKGDKGKREQQKKAQLSPKEKRKLKKEKKNN